MKIYKMDCEKVLSNTGGFFGGRETERNIYWSLTPPENAKFVSSNKDVKCYNTQYAIEYDTEKMSVELLMEIMYQKLSMEEVKTLMKSDEQIERFFMAYITNLKLSEEIQKNLEEQKSRAANAEAMATMAYINSAFD